MGSTPIGSMKGEMSSEDPKFVLWDANAEGHISIFDGFTFGRINGDLTFPTDALLSKSHARIHVNSDEIFIEDLKSTNKTRLNGKEIPPGTRVRLSEGDIIQMGVQKFTVQSASPGVPSEHYEQELEQGENEEFFEADLSPEGEFEEQTPEEVVTSFIHLRNWRGSTRVQASIVSLVWLFGMWPAGMVSDCEEKFHVTLPVQTLVTEALCTLVVALVIVIIHYLLSRFRSQWVGWVMVAVLSAGFYGLAAKINEPQMIYEQTNAEICACSNCKKLETVLSSSCGVWLRGAHLSGVLPFNSLPPATQKSVYDTIRSCTHSK